MNYHTALDVSLRSVSICIVDDGGTIQFEAKVPSEVEEIDKCLRRFNPEVKSVGFEAGTLTQYLTYGLQAAGYEVICLEARQVSAALSAMRNKTDKNDARGIAQILRTGWYSRVHVKSMERHLIRALLSSRKTILKKCVDLENEIRGLIRLLGIRLPGTLNHGAYDDVVRQAIETDGSMVDTLVPMLDARLVLYQTYLKLDNQVKALVREDPICQRLMTVPGVGAITALTFKAAVDDPGRFKRSRTVAAHFGLTPRRFQSGELDNPGRISKAGDPDVRCALYVAAHSLVVRSDDWCALKVWGIQLMKTKGHRRAMVAVARKLAGRDTASDVVERHRFPIRFYRSNDLDNRGTSGKCPCCGRGLDEAVSVCCALKRAHKRGSPNCQTHACSGNQPDCGKERDPHRRQSGIATDITGA